MNGELDTDDAVPGQMLDRAAALLAEGFASGVVVGRTFDGQILLRSLTGDPLIAIGLVETAKDVLIGLASAEVVLDDDSLISWKEDDPR